MLNRPESALARPDTQFLTTRVLPVLAQVVGRALDGMKVDSAARMRGGLVLGGACGVSWRRVLPLRPSLEPVE